MTKKTNARAEICNSNNNYEERAAHRKCQRNKHELAKNCMTCENSTIFELSSSSLRITLTQWFSSTVVLHLHVRWTLFIHSNFGFCYGVRVSLIFAISPSIYDVAFSYFSLLIYLHHFDRCQTIIQTFLLIEKVNVVSLTLMLTSFSYLYMYL